MSFVCQDSACNLLTPPPCRRNLEAKPQTKPALQPYKIYYTARTQTRVPTVSQSFVSFRRGWGGTSFLSRRRRRQCIRSPSPKVRLFSASHTRSVWVHALEGGSLSPRKGGGRSNPKRRFHACAKGLTFSSPFCAEPFLLRGRGRSQLCVSL